MSDPLIRIEGIAKRFTARDGGVSTVFENVHLAVEQGEFVCLIGHSGCGKTTILNVLAGLDTATGGHVFMDGPLPTRQRHCVNSESLAFTGVEELSSLADPAAP